MAERLVLVFSRERITQGVRELAATISAEYAGRELVLVGILRGAFVFLARRAPGLRPAGARPRDADRHGRLPPP